MASFKKYNFTLEEDVPMKDGKVILSSETVQSLEEDIENNVIKGPWKKLHVKQPEDIEKTKEKIKENNGCVIHSSEVRLTINIIGSFSVDVTYGIERNEKEKLFNENNILGKIDGPGKRSKSRVGVSTCIRM